MTTQTLEEKAKSHDISNIRIKSENERHDCSRYGAFFALKYITPPLLIASGVCYFAFPEYRTEALLTTLGAAVLPAMTGCCDLFASMLDD